MPPPGQQQRSPASQPREHLSYSRNESKIHASTSSSLRWCSRSHSAPAIACTEQRHTAVYEHLTICGTSHNESIGRTQGIFAPTKPFARAILAEHAQRGIERPGNGSLAIISLLPPEAMQLQLEVETKKRRIINQCIKNCLVEKIDSRKIHIGVVGRSSVMSEAKKY